MKGNLFTRLCLLAGLLFTFSSEIDSQNKVLLAGPVIGDVGPTHARVVVITDKKFSWKPVLSDDAGTEVFVNKLEGWKNYQPFKIEMKGLAPSKEYLFFGNDSLGNPLFEFTFRTAPAIVPDSFSFLLGSCAFIGPGGQKLIPNGPTSIFRRMMEEDPAFMIWLGDNTYYIGNEFNSRDGMMRKQIKVHLNDDLRAFLANQPNYAIWDDHDYGPNNSSGSWSGKFTALDVFKVFWPNPSFGIPETPGVFFNHSFGDCDFFMLDDRFYRDDSAHASLLGEGQMNWLKEKLKNSKAVFKFISIGSEVLNEISEHESWQLYADRGAFFSFLDENNITGVIFLTGDRHFSELLKLERPGEYPLYDFTCSPLTSFVRKKAVLAHEGINPLRVSETQYLDHNYGKISISGLAGHRKAVLEVKDSEGKLIWEYSISETELK